MSSENHPKHLQHHFDTLDQQFEAGKLGMWLFLATEVLLFGGLFCAYAVYRGNNPELFAYGAQFLDTNLGAINTIILILSSLTMATAVTAAQTDRRRLLLVCLAITFLGGAGFMGIKYVEYSHKFHDNLVWGMRFYHDPRPYELEEEVEVVFVADAERGRPMWMATCRSCHGVAGEGITGQGKDIRGSEFIAGKTDEELLDFVRIGRMPFDPLNTTGIQMPPKGGNPLYKDNELRDIIAFLRTFKVGEGPAAAEGFDESGELFIERSVLPEPATGPPGLLMNVLEAEEAHDDSEAHADAHAAHPTLPSRDPDRPQNAHMFFTVYFLMTGLHGIHVLAGMGMLAWLFVRSLRRHFDSQYFTPVDLGGLYWHIVDLIWIFLFPLFYLI